MGPAAGELPARPVRCDLLVALVLLAACGPEPAAPPWSATTTVPAASAGERNLALGTGEPREPQRFTLEQRLLDAVSRGDRQTIERCLARGASLGVKDDLQRSPVVLAVLDAGDLELVRWLHEKGAALDERDTNGRTALSFAAANGRLDIVHYLVEHGAAVDRADGQQRTPLFHAALGDHADVVAFLIDRGAAVNVRDRFGDTPLIVACAKGHGETATLLLQRGADPSLQDQEGRTAKARSAPGVEPCRRLP